MSGSTLDEISLSVLALLKTKPVTLGTLVVRIRERLGREVTSTAIQECYDFEGPLDARIMQLPDGKLALTPDALVGIDLALLAPPKHVSPAAHPYKPVPPSDAAKAPIAGTIADLDKHTVRPSKATSRPHRTESPFLDNRWNDVFVQSYCWAQDEHHYKALWHLRAEYHTHFMQSKAPSEKRKKLDQMHRLQQKMLIYVRDKAKARNDIKRGDRDREDDFESRRDKNEAEIDAEQNSRPEGWMSKPRRTGPLGGNPIPRTGQTRTPGSNRSSS